VSKGYVSERLCQRDPAKAKRLDLCQREGDSDWIDMFTSTLDWSARTSTIIAPCIGAVPGVHRRP
jgi:hypothetical protein